MMLGGRHCSPRPRELVKNRGESGLDRGIVPDGRAFCGSILTGPVSHSDRPGKIYLSCCLLWSYGRDSQHRSGLRIA